MSATSDDALVAQIRAEIDPDRRTALIVERARLNGTLGSASTGEVVTRRASAAELAAFDLRTAPPSRLPGAYQPARTRKDTPMPPTSTAFTRLLAKGFVQVAPVGTGKTLEAVVTLGKGGIVSLNKMAIEQLGRHDRVAVLIHHDPRQMAIVAHADGATPIRHLRTGGATFAAKGLLRDLGLLGQIHPIVATSPEPGVLVIDLP